MIFLGRSPDTATPGDLRPYQLHMPDNGVPRRRSTCGSWPCGFSSPMTCRREELKRYMQSCTEPRKQPVSASRRCPTSCWQTRTGAKVLGHAQHLLRCRTSGGRGLQPRDQQFRQGRTLIGAELGKGGKQGAVQSRDSGVV